MNPNLRAELERLVRRANGNYDYRFLDALSVIAECPEYMTHPDEVAELLWDISEDAMRAYRRYQ